MNHQQKSKSRHLFYTSLLILLISMPSYVTGSIITINRIHGKIGIVTMNRSENEKTKNQDSIRSFNGNLISKSEMDAFIKHQMDSLNMPGLSIAFINDNKIVYHNALGVKNNETNEKVDDYTIFDAASMSKTVFSFFTLKMIDDGLLDLDTPLYTYMKYPDIAYDERYKAITARMVLSHTSGFPNWRFLDKEGNYDPDRKLTIQFEPGTKFQYSGEGYEYLAKVIAHLKGVEKNELQGLIKTVIFKPLEMKNSSFVWNDYIENHRANGHFRGKLNKGYGNSAKDPGFKASASLQTESKEFSNFLMAIMNNKILSENGLKELLKIQSRKLATERSKEQKYGLGIGIEESGYGTHYSHGGDNLSNTALYMLNLEKKVGYVFFTNSENKNKFQMNLLNFLLNN
ncbi:serine hydrolase domain-containing protein [uncultured Aquimarina sp.]|uniref:serine hydrolase domain-containing protein n=1 Tax=uncultured Aquimarina sp. TaxID=575652 RepID=UPI0026395CF6|nr:serine hydrolase domain-containing protein [uncultured Aquimarina sp.]